MMELRVAPRLMTAFIHTLVASPILTLFIVIGLGYLLGQVSVFGIRFGISGVLFVGIAVGALAKEIALPDIVPALGLIIFVYTIGIQSGPAFFASFNRQGARNNMLAIAVLGLGALLATGVGHALGYSHARIAGLYCGALTNTPAVAAAQERIRFRAHSDNLSPEQVRDLSDEPIVAFGLAYPMGVIGLLIAFQILRRFWHKDDEEPNGDARELQSRDFVVRNPGIVGLSIGEVLQLHREPGFVVSRILHSGSVQLFHPDLRLDNGDIVVVVGDGEALERARQIFGEPSDLHIELDRTELDYRRIFVSSPDVVGKRIGDLDLETKLQATITRIRRGDKDLVPSPEMRLEFGDLVRVLSGRENLASVSQFFGDSIKGTAETDFGSVAIGMVMGALLGMLPIPLPGGTVLRLGLAGGPLLVALILGKLERTGRVTWTMPVSANLTLRQVGLLLFMAGVGTRAGYSFAQTLRANGPQIILAGVIVTCGVALTTMIVAHKFMKIPYASVMGMVSGIHTEPASLTYAAQVSGNDRPNIAYTTVYPIAMIGKILLAQLLI